jgi:hypothetical protein
MSNYVSIKVLQESINIHEIENEARDKWEKEHRKRRRVEQWIIRLLPFGLILMTAIFYGLSAPHTAQLMSLITPTFVGQYLAPLGFELGILIIAALLEAGMRSRAAHVVLWVLLILSIVINIAGAFIAVVSLATGVVLEQDTVNQLLARFTSLPATYQVVLILVPFIGAAIPIVAKLSGEVIVKIALGKIRLERESDEQLWAKESARVMHGALLQAAMQKGAGVKTAGNWAVNVAEQMYSYKPAELSGSTVRAVGKASGISTDQPARVMGFLAQKTVPGQSQSGFLSVENQQSVETYEEKDTSDGLDSKLPRLSKKHVTQWLSVHPEYHLRSDRDVSRAYMLDAFGIDSESGYKTVQRAKKELGL